MDDEDFNMIDFYNGKNNINYYNNNEQLEKDEIIEDNLDLENLESEEIDINNLEFEEIPFNDNENEIINLDRNIFGDNDLLANENFVSKTPFEIYRYFINDEIIDYIIQETNNKQKVLTGQNGHKITKLDIMIYNYIYIFISISSSYN